jgi:hypothetical protein
MKTTLENWRRFLNEGQEQPHKVNRPKKRRKTDDPPSVKKRKQPWDVFPGYDDRNGGLKQLANGIMEDDEEEDEIELLAEPSDGDLNDEELAEIAPALAAAARIAAKTGKIASTASNAADKVSKIAGAVKTASDVAKKVLPDDDEELEEMCIGNPYRDENGHFTDAADHRVFTTGYSGDNSSSNCDHGKWKKNKSSTSHKCGRDPGGKKHPYVCKTGKLRENVIQDEDGECFVKLDYLIQLLEKETAAILENDAQAQQQALAQKCLKMGYTTPQKAFQNLTLTLNSLHKSMKGDLNSEK